MKKIGLLCLALVLALGTMGAGLAYWTETLTIGGTVATGDLSVTFANESCSEFENVGVSESVDTGSCVITYENESADGEKMVVTITNAYPGYGCDISFDVLNDGSIPVDLDDGIVIGSHSTELLITIVNDVAVDDLAVGASEAGILRVQVDPNLTGDTGENSTFTFTATIPAEQFNAD